MSQPTPTPLLKAKMKTAGFAAAAMTLTGAMTLGVTAAPEILASRDHAIEMAQMQAEIDLAASLGIFPTGPGAQIARMAGLGNVDAVLNTLENLADLTGQGGIGDVVGIMREVLDGLTAFGFLPDVRVPGFGPAGVIDAVDGLEGNVGTETALTLLKTALILAENADQLPLSQAADLLTSIGLGEIAGLVRAVEPFVDLLATLPLNVPGTEYKIDIDTLLLDATIGYFDSSADALAVIPTWGLGGTNVALASDELMKMKDTAILVIALRNTSRPGGGILALLNPLSQLVGLDLANADGRGEQEDLGTINFPGIPGIADATASATKTDGNLTTWDITAAYDLLSDAPSTIYNPVSWLNSGVGFVMPTYLVPKSITELLDGDVLTALTSLLTSLNIDVSDEDGNLYITYDSGHLPLLEPFQVLPRTLSYIPGFDISTPFSSSFDDVLRQTVAMGYQDVDLTHDGVGQIPTFVREFDMAGNQAKLWTSPVSFTDGLQVPQALFNALIGDGDETGITGNLLNPGAQDLNLFGSSALGDALYDNGATVAVAGFLRDALLQIRDALNPVFDQVDSNSTVRQLTTALDDAVGKVNGLIDDGLEAGAEKPIVDLSGPMLDVNRFVNKVTAPLDNGIPNAIGNLFNGNSTTAAARGAGDNAVARTSADTDANVLKLPGADLLKNADLGANARKVAEALKNPAAGLKDGADKAEARVSKQFGKVKGNLAAEKARADRLVGAVKSGKPDNVVKTVRENVKERVSQVKKDLNDGAKKVEKTVKKVTDRDAA